MCVCVHTLNTDLSFWFMGIHQRHRLAPSDQHCLRVSQPCDSQLLTLDQRHHTCSTTPHTLTAHAHTDAKRVISPASGRESDVRGVLQYLSLSFALEHVVCVLESGFKSRGDVTLKRLLLR